MTNYEIVQMLLGFFLWMLTMELFFNKYCYTRSEREIIDRGRGEGMFPVSVIIRISGAMTGIALVLFTVGKYLF